ncbi:MAG: aminoglycoside phosphotransferase family protein [Dehalococcoidales bacterium]|nr:aminoglycoside phosphotransferase family protein [Dehalococcoidales bacterium]
MSIEKILSRKAVSDFLEKNGWQPVDVITHGATSDILIIEKNHEKRALKLARKKAKEIVVREHRLLTYLNATGLESNVPRVGDWLEEIEGFQMEYLFSPTPEVKQSETWCIELAQTLRMIHNVKLPDIDEIPDDRPDIALTVSKRFTDQCAVIHKGNDYWKNLPDEYVPVLEIVRRYYDTYIALIPDVEKGLKNTQPAMTHGDLAGDNIMSRSDGTPVFVDWGEARISSGLLDLACLLTFPGWSEETIDCFLVEYYGPEALKKALPGVQVLRKFYRYLTCVSSLWWLIQPEEEKLDTVGRAFFEKLLTKL